MEVLSIHRIHLVCAPVITLCVSVVPLVLSLVYICIAIPFIRAPLPSPSLLQRSLAITMYTRSAFLSVQQWATWSQCIISRCPLFYEWSFIPVA